MFISNKQQLNKIVRSIRVSLNNNEAKVKYNSLHQMFAKSLNYNNQASLIKSLPNEFELKNEKAREIEREIDSEFDCVSNYFEILSSHLNRIDSEYQYLMANITIAFSTIMEDSGYEIGINSGKLKNFLECSTGFQIEGGTFTSMINKIIIGENSFDAVPVFKDKKLFKRAVSSRELMEEEPLTLDSDNRFCHDEHNPLMPFLNTGVILFLVKIKKTSEFKHNKRNLSISEVEQLSCGIFESGFQALMGSVELITLEDINLTRVRIENDEQLEIFEANQDSPEIQNLKEKVSLFDIEENDFCFYIDSIYSDYVEMIKSSIMPHDLVFYPEHWFMEQLDECMKDEDFQFSFEVGFDSFMLGYFQFKNGKGSLRLVHFDEIDGITHSFGTSINFGFIYDICKKIDNVQFMYAKRGMDGLFKNEDTFIPCIKNTYSESVKNWPVEDHENITSSSREFLFQTRLHILKGKGVKTVIVDDYREIYGDMTGIMLVSFYDGNDRQVAELSYCIMRQNDRDIKEINCADIDLDNIIKKFCSDNSFVYKANIHEIEYSHGDREYNYSAKDSGYIASSPDDFEMNSIQLMSITLEDKEEVDVSKLEKLSSDLFRYCLTSDGEPSESFDYHLVTNFDDKIMTNPLTSNVEKFTELTILSKNEDRNIDRKWSSKQFIGGYDLRGMSEIEAQRSIKNSMTRSTSSLDGVSYLNDKMQEIWCDKLGIKSQKIIIIFN